MLHLNKRALPAVAILLIAIPVSGQSISDVNGTVKQDSTITIIGSGFGSKSTPAPTVYDNMESGSFNAAWTSTGSVNGTPPGLFINATDGYAGSDYCGYRNFTGDYGAAAFRKETSASKIFISYWMKLGASWDWGEGQSGDPDQYLSSVKFIRLYSGQQEPMHTYFIINSQTVGQFRIEYEYIDDKNYTANNYSGPNCNLWPGDGWHQIQMQWGESSVAGELDGVSKVWVDGQLYWNVSDAKTNNTTGPTTKYPLYIGLHNSRSGVGDEGNNEFYIDEVYYDTSWARVEIGDDPVYDSCTHREVQLPTFWAADGDSVQVTVNTGSFGDQVTAYAFVVNSSGDATTGHVITINSTAGNPVGITDPPSDLTASGGN